MTPERHPVIAFAPLPGSVAPPRACYGEAERSRAKPWERVPGLSGRSTAKPEALRRGRIGGTGLRPVGPYPARRFAFSRLSHRHRIAQLCPSPACEAAGEGWPKAREGGTSASPRPTFCQHLPAPLCPSPACEAAGEGGRRPGGGHFRASDPVLLVTTRGALQPRPAQPCATVLLARSAPLLRAKPRGRVAEGREGGTSASLSHACNPQHPAQPRPSLACMSRRSAAKPGAAGEGGRRPGGGHFIIPEPTSQHSAPPAFSPLLSGRGAGGEGAGGGHYQPSAHLFPPPSAPRPLP